MGPRPKICISVQLFLEFLLLEAVLATFIGSSNTTFFYYVSLPCIYRLAVSTFVALCLSVIVSMIANIALGSSRERPNFQ